MSKIGKVLLLLAGISLGCFALLRFVFGSWVPFLWVVLGLFVGLLLGAIWLDRLFYKEFLTMKTTRQGMSMGVMIGLVMVILVAVNFVAVRKYKTFDFSMAKINTLSDQSIKLVKDLKEDLTIFYFYKNGTEGVETNRRAFIDLMKKYQDQSEKVKLEFIEVNERPDMAEKYNVHQGTQMVVMDYQGRQSRIEKIDEQEITSGIVKVTRTSDKKIYVLEGQNELSLTASKDGNSIAMLKEMLTSNRYTINEMTFTKSGQVPIDADVLLIIGPKSNFLDVEIKAIEDYLRRGGSVVVALASGFKTGLEPLLKHVGIVPKGNYIASLLQTPMGAAVDPRFARGSVFSPDHQITKPFGNSQFVVFRLPTALTKVEPLLTGETLDEIVKTSDDVMAFNDTKFEKGGEKGAVALGMAVHGKWDTDPNTKEFNMLVFGDANFMNDQYLYQNLNRDLVLNSIAFLAKEENLISITPKEVEMTQMMITETQFALFLLGFVIPLPMLLFISSGWMWYRRRYS